MRKLVIKKCKHCNAMVKIIEDCNCENCGIKCCSEQMEELIPNAIEEKMENHTPTYERVEDEIAVKINHVMEKEHYIQWISLVSDNKEYTVTLYPEQDALVRLPYIKGATIYAYCNKHGLWKKEVE